MSEINWDYWRKLALWPLDVACQLVYGEDPKGMLPEDNSNPDIDGRPDFVNLYHQAIAAIKARTLSTVFDLEVRPAEFLAWAQGQGVPLLRELADIPCPPPAGGWPWGSYETKLLRDLAAAAEHWWKNYDPSDPTTAPTNQQVIDWLTKEREGVTPRAAASIATILRADGLSPGPRK
jgi:hypothetical protein